MIRIARTASLAALVATTALGLVSAAPRDALAEDKKPAAKDGDAKPAAKDGDAKPAAKDGDAKPAAKDGDAKPAAKDGDAKPAAKDGDAKPAAKDGDAKPAAKEADAKAETDAKPAEPEKPKATGIDEARRRMEVGQAEFAKGEYAKATTEFEAAYEALPNVAFLFNAAFAAEKAGDRQRAIAQYEKYLVGDPNSAERPQIEETIARLRKELTAPATTEGAPTTETTDQAAKPADQKALNEIRSLVQIESDPAGAPVTIYERLDPTAPEYKPGQPNNGWKKVVENIRTPKGIPLKVGHYYAVIEAFQDYKRSGTPVDVTPGQVVIFKANLSQGEFLGYLRVKSNVEGAKVFLDDPTQKLAPWARTPQGGTVNDGKHDIVVTAPGYKPFEKKGIDVRHGQQAEVEATLERVAHGYLVLGGNVDMPEVLIDGAEQAPYARSAKAPYRLKLPAGKHTLVLDAEDKKKLTAEIEIPRGQNLPVSALLNPSYPRGKAIGLGVVGALVGAGGGVLFWQAKEREAGKQDDLQKAMLYGSYGAWGLSGLLVGLSVFYSVYDPLPDSELDVKKARDYGEDDELPDAPKKTAQAGFRGFVAPMVGDNAFGLGAFGSF